MDVKDRKILEVLDLEPKIPLSRLAKKVRISQQVVDYRVKKLQEQGIINHFGTLLNLSYLGFQQYRIFFQFADISQEQKEIIIKYLHNHSQVYWAALVGNIWDLLIVVFVKDYEGLEKFLDDLFQNFKGVFKDYESYYTLYHEFYGHKYLENNTKSFFVLDYARNNEQIILDKVDYLILDKIKSNCRLSSLEISKECNVSYKTVQNRIHLMEKFGLIAGYRIFLHSEDLNYKAYFLLISFQHYAKDIEKKLLAYAKEHSAITQSLKLFGRHSILFHIRVQEYQELQNIIIEMRNKYPIIGTYEVIPVFENISINHFPMSKEFIKKK